MARSASFRLVAALESSTLGQCSEFHVETPLLRNRNVFNHTNVWASPSEQISLRSSLVPPPVFKCLGATLAGSLVALLGMFAEGHRDRKHARLGCNYRSNGANSSVGGTSPSANHDNAVVESCSSREEHGRSTQCATKVKIGEVHGDNRTSPVQLRSQVGCSVAAALLASQRPAAWSFSEAAPSDQGCERDVVVGSSEGSSTCLSWCKKSEHRPSETLMKVERHVKSILNKMTRESFAKLYSQLLDCLAKTEAHEGIISVVAREVFAKATLQHRFVEMYADVCTKLNDDLHHMGMQVNFRRALLDQCQQSFNLHLDPPRIDSAKDQEDQYEQLVKYKTTMLGNIRLIGNLLNKGMLSAKIIFSCADELLSIGSPEALETLCVFLSTIGATFDTPRWRAHARLEAIFMRTELFAEDPRQSARTRCLLKDVFDRRRNRWRESRQTAPAVGATRAGGDRARSSRDQDRCAERDLLDGKCTGKVGVCDRT